MIVSELVRAIAIGGVLGAATGVPLGVVNLAVIETARRRGAATGAALGLGGALADGTHAAIAFFGYGALLAAHPTVRAVVAIVCAVSIAAFALRLWRTPSRLVEAAAPPSTTWAVLRGLSLTLPNPAPLAAWTVVAGALFPTASMAVAGVAALAVCVGSACWFAALARWASRSVSNATRDAIWGRAMAMALLAVATWSLVRSLRS